MNSLKKGEEVPLLNFEGGPGILLLNFEVGPGVPFLNFRGVTGPTFKLWGESRVPVPGSGGPAVLVPLLHHAFIKFVFIVCQVEDYQNIMKLNCRPPALTSHETF